MKLDKDLVRNILLAIEADTGDPRGWIDLEIPDHSHVEVAYHVELLAEANFIEAIDLCSIGPDGYDWKPKRLTYEGHEFLDTIRDNQVWKETKEIAKQVGAGSVTMLFEIGKAYIKQQLVPHGIHLQ